MVDACPRPPGPAQRPAGPLPVPGGSAAITASLASVPMLSGETPRSRFVAKCVRRIDRARTWRGRSTARRSVKYPRESGHPRAASPASALVSLRTSQRSAPPPGGSRIPSLPSARSPFASAGSTSGSRNPSEASVNLTLATVRTRSRSAATRATPAIRLKDVMIPPPRPVSSAARPAASERDPMREMTGSGERCASPVFHARGHSRIVRAPRAGARVRIRRASRPVR